MEEEREDPKGYKVTDRRPTFDDSSPKADSSQEKSPPPHTEAPPFLTFSSFLLSLGTSALINLGAEADPLSGKKEVHLPQAREIIDLLAILEEKTGGNLTREEEDLLSQLLFTLRMRYIEGLKSSGG